MATQSRNLKQFASIFKILGDRTRLTLLTILKTGERNVTELCKLVKASQPTVSRHLGILRMANLVVNRRSGKEIFYSLCRPQLVKNAKALTAILTS